VRRHKILDIGGDNGFDFGCRRDLARLAINTPTSCGSGSSRFLASPDARIQQAFQQPTLNVNIDRSLTGLVGLSEKDAATAMQTTLAGSSANFSDLLAQSQDGGLLSGLDPDATVQSRHDERAEKHTGDDQQRRRHAAARRPAVRHLRDAVPRADHVQRRPRP
jgi:hypothetical protein